MVKVVGKVANELAYKVIAKGYAFEVRVHGKVFRIKHVPGEGKLPLAYLGSALGEVKKFLEARGGAVMGGLVPMLI